VAERDVWVVGAFRVGAPSPWTLEVLSGARSLADAMDTRVGVLIPEALSGKGEEALAAHGAEIVVSVEEAGFAPTVETVVGAALNLAKSAPPLAVLFLDSSLGRAAAAQVAAALGGSLLAGCERLRREDSSIEALRSCFGGQLAQRVRSGAGPLLATLAEHSFAVRSLGAGRAFERRNVAASRDERIEVLERRAPDPDELGLAEAEVLVSGGVGVGQGGFELLSQLARRLSGTVAATRAAVDKGWVARSKQVGQTGSTVAPRLYLACGISGAREHMVAVRNAGAVVALNTDPGAPIMRQADLGVVGDVSEVVPELLRRLSR
jgi:electron transfer flavoprotein alpha subunit